MFKKFKLLRKSGAKDKLKQRGQIFLVYAFFVPLLFFFVGITFDLSWYFVNVSRMQNAADAAVIAGAQTLIGENGNLYYYVDKTFVKGYNEQNVSEFYQDTTLGDTIAKTYVRKNLARRSGDWDDDTIIDSWTKNELYFESILLGDKNDNFETLYYHVMLEEDVPHMFLNGWFDDTMNAKVSAVVKISQYMKGYDFFEQMKYLGYKRTRLAANTKDERTVTPVTSDSTEKFNFKEDDIEKNFFDSLFTGYPRNNTTANVYYGDGNVSSDVNSKKKLRRRIININTVYPIRDYDFYYDYSVLKKIREGNSAYKNLNDDDLASALAKDSFDPMYIFIESEKDFPQQLIININRSNMNEFSDRPIIFIYEEPENYNHYPVILNLNADFRGILYAPNNPVVINGNERDFEGFVIAESYVEFMPDDDAYYNYADHNTITEEFVDDYGDIQYTNSIPVDDYGYVLYKMDYDGSYHTIQPAQTTNNEILFDKEPFNLTSSVFDSFGIVKLENHTESFKSSKLINNLFLEPPPKKN